MIAVVDHTGRIIARFDSYPEAAAHRLEVCPSWGLGVGGYRIVGGDRVSACEWCGQVDGHENGCRLGLGPDEIAERQPCCPCGLKTRPGSCGWCEE